jgi:hypothetical protein
VASVSRMNSTGVRRRGKVGEKVSWGMIFCIRSESPSPMARHIKLSSLIISSRLGHNFAMALNEGASSTLTKMGFVNSLCSVFHVRGRSYALAMNTHAASSLNYELEFNHSGFFPNPHMHVGSNFAFNLNQYAKLENAFSAIFRLKNYMRQIIIENKPKSGEEARRVNGKYSLRLKGQITPWGRRRAGFALYWIKCGCNGFYDIKSYRYD